jgi:hypothetical protein
VNVQRSLKVAVVIALAAAGFAVASIASGSSVLGSDTTTTGVTVTATTSSTVTVRTPSKVTICHRTGSKKNPFVTITVSASSLFAHFKHGDQPGACTTAKIKAILKAQKINAAKSRAHHHR